MRVLRILFAGALLLGGWIAHAQSASARKFTSVHGPKGHVTPTRKRGSRVFHAGFGSHRDRSPKRRRARVHKRKPHVRRHGPKFRGHGRRSSVHVVRFGTHGSHRPKRVRKHRHKRTRPRISSHFAAFGLPDQHLYPPYYRSKRPHPRQMALHGHIEGGLTVRQGSPWRGTIKGAPTVQGGSPWRGHIAAGRTVGQGSRWAGHIKGGPTSRQGSRWSSRTANWRFTGYRAPMRPSGLTYFNARPRHAGKAGRHHFPKARYSRGPKARSRALGARGPASRRGAYARGHRY